MNANSARWWRVGPLIGAILFLGACAGHHHGADAASGDDEGINAYPTNYKSDILGGMHAYLNDPTGIRDAAISEPALKSIGGKTRYVVCLRFNGKQSGNSYAGVKDVAAVFLAGRFDQFVEKANEPCADATYAPFPELGKLTR
jgi:hypothetical protein